MKNLLLFVVFVFILSGCSREEVLTNILVEPTFTIETVEQIQEDGEIVSRNREHTGSIILDLNLASRDISNTEIDDIRVSAEVKNRSIAHEWSIDFSLNDRIFLHGDVYDESDPPNGGCCSVAEILTVGIDRDLSNASMLRISSVVIILNDGSRIPLTLTQDTFTIR